MHLQIKAAAKLIIESVDVPEWGGTVLVKMLSGSDSLVSSLLTETGLFNAAGSAAALRDPQPALLREAQLRRLHRSRVERGLRNIDDPVFLGVLAE